ncbi:MAG: PQQ-binding-like beta-propeller repeat protein [Bacteroidota bacterium]|nr:PQQ-binding-like beta-propeller repeat protein [Bacteroidota bacterium]
MAISSFFFSRRAVAAQIFSIIVLLISTSVAQDWPMVNKEKGRSSWIGPDVHFPSPPVKKTPISVPKDVESLIYSQGVLYAMSSGSPNTITAIDATTGSILWWDSVASSVASCDFVPAVWNDLVFAGGQRGIGLYAFDRLTGRLRWMKSIGSLYCKAPIVDDSSLYIMRDSLRCLDPSTGSTRWVKPYTGTASPALDDSRIYVCTNNAIVALAKSDGALQWSLNKSIPSYPSVAVANGVLYASSLDTIAAYDAATGTVIWTHPLEGKTLARLATNAIAFTDSILCYAFWSDTSGKGGIAALDIRTGSLLWSYSFPVQGAFTPTIVDNVVYVTDWMANHLRGFRIRTGEIVFHDSTSSYMGQPIFANGILYVPAGSGIVPFAPAGTAAEMPDNPHTALFIETSPNPFSTSTVLRVMCKPYAPLRLSVFDGLGRRTASLYNGMSTGTLDIRWDGKDDHGMQVPPGVYHVVAETDTHVQRSSIVFIR